MAKTALKSKKFEKIGKFSRFWVILGSLGSTKKFQKPPNTYRTKLKLCELNFMGNTLEVI